MATLLVTGFEPFAGETLNPSWEAAKAVDGERVGGTRLAARQLPCVIGNAQQMLAAAIDETRPALVLCMGLAGGRAEIAVERVAVNLVDARIPDNAGQQPVDEPVVADGPAAYFARLPVKTLVRALRDQDIPATLSYSAGTYACNAVFYALLHTIATQRPELRGGFIHLPCLPAMEACRNGAPSLPLDTLVRAVRILAGTALAVEQDLLIASGALH